MLNTVITYPIPPYSNVPIEPQNYQPSVFFISDISLGQLTTVTTSVNHNYVIGQLVRLLIPNGFGSIRLNEQTGHVMYIPAPNQVVLNINSQNVSPFENNAILTTKAQITAVGAVNTGPINSNGRSQTSTIVPGSFINIS